MEEIKNYIHTLPINQGQVNTLMEMIEKIAHPRKVKKADRKVV